MRNHSKIFSEHLETIKTIIRDYHKFVDGVIEKYNRRQSENAEVYNETALASATALNKAEAQGAVEAESEIALRKISLTFDDVEKELAEWIIEPTPEIFMNLLSGVQMFDMEVSGGELEMLSQTASGSYFASKILAGIASKSGIDYPFVPADELENMIDVARHETALCIKAYTGNYENIRGNEWLIANLGKFDLTRRLIALEYLNRDENAITRLEDVLTQSTDRSFSLLPSDQDRINNMFSDIAPENRLTHMVELIENHPQLKGRLKIYDAECFREAMKIVSNKKLNAKTEAVERVKEASRAAMEASKEFVVSQLETA